MGEGLQHQDGHSLLLASAIPACQAYDSAFAFEVAAIVQHGITKMYGEDPADIFYYITLYNENIQMPPQPSHISTQDIINGLYQWAPAASGTAQASILFSGSAFAAASQAAAILRTKYSIDVDLWSATSYKSLRDDAMEVERWNRLHPTERKRRSHVDTMLGATTAPVIAVTDFLRIVSEQVATFVPSRRFLSLGTDGMGRSDTREALRRFFETDAEHVVIAVLTSLVGTRNISRETVAQAIIDLGINPEAENGLTRD
jgi:pyruvate dehydrogenase E1 component